MLQEHTLIAATDAGLTADTGTIRAYNAGRAMRVRRVIIDLVETGADYTISLVKSLNGTDEVAIPVFADTEVVGRYVVVAEIAIPILNSESLRITTSAITGVATATVLMDSL